MNCPKCNSEIKKENINIQSDIAQCLDCDTIFKISENIEEEIDVNFDINGTPNGTWIKKGFNTTIIGATTRSPIAFFLIPFMLVWSGGSLVGIYGTQIMNQEFDIFLSLFGVPFLLGSIVLLSLSLMTIWGKVELILDNKGGEVFTGIGNIGISKSFLWNDISIIKEEQANHRTSRQKGSHIVFEGKKRIAFGLGLKEERRYYLLQAIKKIRNRNC